MAEFSSFVDVRVVNFNAALFVNQVMQCDDVQVRLVRLDNEKVVDARSLLGVLSLGVQGRDVRILVRGKNQSRNQEIAENLKSLIA